MTCKIKITTRLKNYFEEIIDTKDFNEKSVEKSIESTKKQIFEGLKGNEIVVEADTQVIWSE